jgi:hypothetical protein
MAWIRPLYRLIADRILCYDKKGHTSLVLSCSRTLFWVGSIRGNWMDSNLENLATILEFDKLKYSFIHSAEPSILWHVDPFLCTPEIRECNNRKGIARIVFYVVRSMTIAKQLVAKHVPAEAYCGTVGRPFLGNRAVHTPTNCWNAVFSVRSVLRLYNAEFQVSSQ